MRGDLSLGRTVSFGLGGLFVSWMAVAALHFLLTPYGYLLPLVPIAWLVAIAVSVLSATMLVGRHRMWAAVVIAAAVGAGLIVVTVDWERAYAKTWYATHRGTFDKVVELADRNALAGLPRFGVDEIKLPADYSGAAVAGRAFLVGPDADTAVLYLPVEIWTDGQSGFAHIPAGRPITPQVGALGDRARFLIHLGKGWWWYEASLDRLEGQ